MITSALPALGGTRAAGGLSDRRFFVTMGVGILVAAFAGFARTYYLKQWTGAAPLSPLVHVHAVVFTCWLLVYLTQAALVATNRISWHRILGAGAGVLAAGIVWVGYLVTIESGRRGFMGVFPDEPSAFADPLAFMALGLGDIVTFAVLATAGFGLRRHREAHKRLMLLATISLLPAALVRIPLGPMRVPVAFAVLLAFLLAGPLRDWRMGRTVHPANVWGGLLILLSTALRPLVARSTAWHSFASWLVG